MPTASPNRGAVRPIHRYPPHPWAAVVLRNTPAGTAAAHGHRRQPTAQCGEGPSLPPPQALWPEVKTAEATREVLLDLCELLRRVPASRPAAEAVLPMQMLAPPSVAAQPPPPQFL